MTDPGDKDTREGFAHRDALRSAGGEGPSDAQKARMWRNIETRLSGPASRRLPQLVPVFAAFVVFVVALAAIYLVARSRLFPPDGRERVALVLDAGAGIGPGPVFVWTDETGAALEPGATAEASRGEKKTLKFGKRATATLDDGAAVEIGAGTLAAVVKSGAAEFSVEKDPAAPAFVVGAADVTVTVIGTSFRVYVKGTNVSVNVSRGIVRVASAAETVELRAGEAWSRIEDSQARPRPEQQKPAGDAPDAVKEKKKDERRDHRKDKGPKKDTDQREETRRKDDERREKPDRRDKPDRREMSNERPGGDNNKKEGIKEKPRDESDDLREKREERHEDRKDRGADDAKPGPRGQPKGGDDDAKEERKDKHERPDRDHGEMKEEKVKDRDKDRDKRRKKHKKHNDRDHRKDKKEGR